MLLECHTSDATPPSLPGPPSFRCPSRLPLAAAPHGCPSRLPQAFLFSGFLCLEESGYFLPKRRLIPMRSVLSVLSGATSADSATSNGFTEGTEQWRWLDLQMMGTSIRIAMEAQRCVAFAQSLERCRLRALEEADDDADDAGDADLNHASSSAGVADGGATEYKSYGAKGASGEMERVRRRQSNDVAAGLAGSGAAAYASDAQLSLSQIAELDDTEWSVLLRGAQLSEHRAGSRVIDAGTYPDGLLQVARGVLRVEVKVPGRPQAIALDRLQSGDILGEVSFLLGTTASASVVVESEEGASIIRLSRGHLQAAFATRPEVAGKFYYFLARRAAERLRRTTSIGASDQDLEIVLDQSSSAPKSVIALARNPAYFMIFSKFVHGEPSCAPEFGHVIELCRSIQRLQGEASVHQREITLRSILETYFGLPAAASSSNSGSSSSAAQAEPTSDSFSFNATKPVLAVPATTQNLLANSDLTASQIVHDTLKLLPPSGEGGGRRGSAQGPIPAETAYAQRHAMDAVLKVRMKGDMMMMDEEENEEEEEDEALGNRARTPRSDTAPGLEGARASGWPEGTRPAYLSTFPSHPSPIYRLLS